MALTRTKLVTRVPKPTTGTDHKSTVNMSDFELIIKRLDRLIAAPEQYTVTRSRLRQEADDWEISDGLP